MSHTIAAIRASNPMWVYERNYKLLLSLFPALKDSDEQSDVISYHSESGEVGLKVTERCRYTLTLVLNETYGDSMIPAIKMHIRIYNDANVAEVISYQGKTRLLPEFMDLNRGDRFSSKEKRRTNQLLHDWLVAIQKEQLYQSRMTNCSI